MSELISHFGESVSVTQAIRGKCAAKVFRHELRCVHSGSRCDPLAGIPKSYVDPPSPGREHEMTLVRLLSFLKQRKQIIRYRNIPDAVLLWAELHLIAPIPHQFHPDMDDVRDPVNVRPF